MLTLLAALAVHELRYSIAGVPQDAHAHAYMSWLIAVAAALAVLAATELGGRLLLGGRGAAHAEIPPAGVRWLALSSLLTAIFAVQESVETLVAHGRVDLVESMLVHGGWVAGPLALALAAVVALLVRGARALLARLAGRRPRVRARPERPAHSLPRRISRRLPALACHLSGRAPPPLVA